MASRKQPGRLNKNKSTSNGHRQSHSPAPERLPLRFFRTILPSTMQDMKLKLPANYVSKYGEELSNVAKLIVANSPPWQVGLKKSKSSIWFDEGWSEFMEHYSIHDGYLLFFKYRGLSKFNVLIFDESYCEIQYRQFGQQDVSRNETLDSTPKKKSSGINKSIRSVEFNDCPNSQDQHHNMNCEKQVKEEPFEMTDSDDDESPRGKRWKRSYVTDFNAEETKGGKQQKRREMKESDADETKGGKWQKHHMPSTSGTKFGKFLRASYICAFLNLHVFCPENFYRLLSCIFEAEDLLSPRECEKQPKCEDLEISSCEIYPGRYTKSSKASEKAIYDARMFKPKHPSFMVVLHRCHGSFLFVPYEFGKKHLSKAPQYMILQVSDTRQWSVRVIKTRNGYWRLGKGWKVFFRENNLHNGDVCVFELARINILLEVSIFRAVQEVE